MGLKTKIKNIFSMEYLRKGFSLSIGISLGLAVTTLIAVTVSGVMNTFSSGETLDAAKMNENFTSLKTAIETIETCPDDMVDMGTYCIDKYEASADTSRVIATALNGAIDRGTGSTTDAIYAAQSASGTDPYVNITWFDAARACAAAGKRLPTNQEWQIAAMGTPDNFGSGINDACNVNSGVVPSGSSAAVHPSGTGAHKTGTAANCISNPFSDRADDGVYDMVGNVVEWTADWFVGGTNYINSGADNDAYTTWPDGYGSLCSGGTSCDATWNLGSRVFNGTAWVNGLPAAALRGSSWSSGSGAGVFALALDSGPSNSNMYIGFRCAKSK
ncbi:MAG: formylglycine-generating enzyme family protein [Spirochaetia bacterium]|nr:formylglycine-generating enzyme family protein [Spirochaetia bacterium]